MKMTKEIFDWVESNFDRQLELHKTLAQIPAPSGKEEMRVEFITGWLRDHGVRDVFVDDALNVICPFGMTDSNQLVVYCAHSDVVFPDMTPLPLKEEDGRLCCPGIGDDTAGVVPLMMVAEYIAKNDLKATDEGVLIVINSCEEGLGNLKGTRKLMETYGSRVKEFISFDGRSGGAVDKAVGSRRFKIEIDTEGGHSFSKFGNRNAIAYLASLIDTLYTVKVPSGGMTTYNVGTISGGTSVNTIAQHAEMLYEFRSDDRTSLEIMDRHLQAAIEFYRTKDVQVTVTLVGDRPCVGDVDEEAWDRLRERANNTNLEHNGVDLKFVRGSTDCNIPLSMGIPALTLGTYMGNGAHTREEYVELDSLLPGAKFAFDMVLDHFA